MKIIQHVKTKLNTKHSIDTAGIIKQIEEYDIVSFDIFDTLLKRNVKKPTDVFRYMEKKYNKEGFFKARIEAEKKARAKKNTEVTLKDIYEEMPFDFSKEELETEAELLIQNDWIMPVYKKALQSKIVIIVSDMYLPESFIVRILKREKIEGYKKLYLSSSVGKMKNSEELFDFVLDEITHGKKIIHIGDSYKADYRIPRRKGIDAIHIPTNVLKEGIFQLKNMNIECNILDSFLNNTSPINQSEYYRFGYEKFGMFLWGYSRWLYKSIKNAGIDNVYFFSRDGLLMKKAFDILFNDIQTHYLEVSRRALRVPILWMNYELEHVVNMISPSKLVSLTTIFDGVGLDINAYVELIKKYGFELNSTFDRKDILNDKDLNDLYSELSFDIESVSKQEYQLLVKYIKQNKLAGDFAIVDIGWSGGMQRYLVELLNKLGVESHIKGYYIGVADYYKRNVTVVPSLDLNGYLFDFSHDENAKDKRSAFVGLFETLFLEQGGSVKNYTEKNDCVASNRLSYEYLENGKPTYEYQCVMDIQKGALDFIQKLGNVDFDLSADTLFRGLSETGLVPKRRDIKMFADFRFFDEGETQYLAKPKSIFFYMIHLKTLKTDFLSSRWKIGFMKRLLKIDLPYEKLYRVMLKYK